MAKKVLFLIQAYPGSEAQEETLLRMMNIALVNTMQQWSSMHQSNKIELDTFTTTEDMRGKTPRKKKSDDLFSLNSWT